MYIFLLASLLSVGALFTHFFFGRSPWYVKLSLWFFSGAIIFTWLLFLLTAFVGYDGAQIISIALGGGIATYYTVQTVRNSSAKKLLKRFSAKGQYILRQLNANKIAVGLFLTWCIVFTQLAYTHNFMERANELITAGSAYGDFALHATYIHYFAFQPQLDLDSPVYATEKTTYPFLLNFLSSQFVRTGLSLQQSMILTSVPFMFIFLLLLWHAVRAAEGKLLAWILSSAFFLFSGGVGIVHFFTDWQESSRSLWEFLQNQQVDYAHYFQINLHWSNVIADYIIPQRSIVIGFGLTALFMATFLRNWKSSNLRFREVVGSSILIGLIPFFHIHSFITLFPLLIWCSLWLLKTGRITRLQFGILLLLPLALATPQLYWQFFHTSTESFMRIQPGWTNAGNDIITFWLRNWGLSTTLWIIGLITLFTSKKISPLPILLFPLYILFISTNIIVFQPNNYDNMKLMLFVYLAVCFSAGIWIEKLSQKKKYLIPIAIFAFALTSTGIVSVIRIGTLRWPIAGEQSQRVAQLVRTQTDPAQIFLTADSHNHPVPMLAGRKVLLGYRGWLWTYGIDYSQVEADTLKMFAGGAKAVELLNSYEIGYVFIGPVEKELYRANTSYFESHFEKVVSDPSGSVYKIHRSQ